MKAATKLSGDERRAAIIRAVRRVFAEKGFDGTTTRELADAAGVSEALLFKHFPNKEALYVAIKLSCCNEQDHEKFEQLRALEPSASTLVLLVQFLVSRVVRRRVPRASDQAIQSRLLLRSLAENGEFARSLMQLLANNWIPKIEECLAAAVAHGEAIAGPVSPNVCGWLAHHLAAMVMFHLLHSPPVVDYGIPGDELVRQACWFILRGMGLKESAIERHYDAASS